MADADGFMRYKRASIPARAASERVGDFKEFYAHLSDKERARQGARCMDCGVPFCQSDYGCPVDNLIPEWNDLIRRGDWEGAYRRLRQTNNFPEFTGRVCPAPCETACVLGINEPPVTIKDNERAIADRGDDLNLLAPRVPTRRTGKRVAIVGGGPAGLAAADQLNQAGHAVTVFERDDRVGGLLMYGIPNMKLDKALVERRTRIMAEEGVRFRVNAEVGANINAARLLDEHDALLLACGATAPRDLDVPGRELAGVHFAMDFLKTSAKRLLDSSAAANGALSADKRNVIVVGGGDTGTDCIATAVRQGARGMVNFELLARPAAERPDDEPWPLYPRVYKLDYGHEESAQKYGEDPRKYSISIKRILGDKRVEAVETVRIKWRKRAGERPTMEELPNSREVWRADLVLLALGFRGPEQRLVSALNLPTDARSNIAARYEDYRTPHAKIFAAGDARRGQSLVVWAIKEGRGAAREIDRALMGETLLP